MHQPNFHSHPLIQSVVYRSLIHAIQAIGLPELAQSQFITEITPLLKSGGNAFGESEESLVRLWKSILRGQVIATEFVENETMVFYVRGGFGGTVADVRLTCQKHQWHVQSVISVFTQPLIHTLWFQRAAIAAAIVIAGILGFVIHQPSTSATPPVSQPAALAPVSNDIGTQNATPDASANVSTSDHPQPKASKPVPQSVTFTVKPGMSLFDLAKFLHTEHFANSAMEIDMAMKKAGVDKAFKPGVYTFQTGMSESQVIAVLKQGPAK